MIRHKVTFRAGGLIHTECTLDPIILESLLSHCQGAFPPLSEAVADIPVSSTDIQSKPLWFWVLTRYNPMTPEYLSVYGYQALGGRWPRGEVEQAANRAAVSSWKSLLREDETWSFWQKRPAPVDPSYKIDIYMNGSISPFLKIRAMRSWTETEITAAAQVCRQRGFATAYTGPYTSAEVPDTLDARRVTVYGPDGSGGALIVGGAELSQFTTVAQDWGLTVAAEWPIYPS